jgi:hypothetical protein
VFIIDLQCDVVRPASVGVGLPNPTPSPDWSDITSIEALRVHATCTADVLVSAEPTVVIVPKVRIESAAFGEGLTWRRPRAAAGHLLASHPAGLPDVPTVGLLTHRPHIASSRQERP